MVIFAIALFFYARSEMSNELSIKSSSYKNIYNLRAKLAGNDMILPACARRLVLWHTDKSGQEVVHPLFRVKDFSDDEYDRQIRMVWLLYFDRIQVASSDFRPCWAMRWQSCNTCATMSRLASRHFSCCRGSQTLEAKMLIGTWQSSLGLTNRCFVGASPACCFDCACHCQWSFFTC